MSQHKNGLFFVHKPQGITSHDVVFRSRRLLSTKKVGHAGTLDPMATGLLILGFNRGTKFMHYLLGLDKKYSATVRLGGMTDTDDADGTVMATHDVKGLTEQQVAIAFARLRGTIEQRPSTVSAIKIDGKRAYELAREGKAVDIPARTVSIYDLAVKSFRRLLDNEHEFIECDIEVHCSSGTYIRAIARDVGSYLGVGGYLTRLERTAIGPFDLERAYHFPALKEQLGKATQLFDPSLFTVDLATAARLVMPTRQLTAAEATALQQGKSIAQAAPEAVTNHIPKGETILHNAKSSGHIAAYLNDQLIAIVKNVRFKGEHVTRSELLIEV